MKASSLAADATSTAQNVNLSLEDFNPDLPAVKRRWDAWWQNGMVDRPVLRFTAPLDKPRTDIAPQADLDVDPTTHWTDENFLVRRTLEALRTTYYAGDSLPIAYNGISAGHTLYFGAQPSYSNATVFVHAAPCAEGSYPSLDGWEQSPYWQMARRHIATLASESQRRWLTAPFWGNSAADTLAGVRGFEQFYMDLALDRAWVLKATRQMGDNIRKINRELFDLAYAQNTADGYGGILGYWASQPHMHVDADVTYSVSPRDFQEIFLPPMIESMADFPLRAYHLDGEGALRHLDALLGVKELQAIQWVQGAGGGGILKWLDVIKKIQSAGKAVQLSCGADEIEPLLKEVRPEGLCISTWAATESDARRVVDRVNRVFGR
jgi:hypothetical protein